MTSYSTQPLAVDPYSRFFTDMFDEKAIIGVPTAFQGFFGRPETGGKTLFSPNSSVVEIDIMRGNERIAALVPRGNISRPLGSTQKNVNVQKFSSFSRRFPLSIEEGDITADQLEFRAAGENPYEGRDKLQRMRSLANSINQEMVRRTVRMFEVLCAQSILTAKMDAIIGTSDPDLQYDFRRKATHTFTVPVTWATVTTDILGDFDTSADLVREDGHMHADMAILGRTAMESVIANTAIKALADNRRFELIEINTANPVPPKFARFIAGGLVARGRLRTPGGWDIWLFTYNDGYTNSAGNYTKYVGDEQCLVCSSEARCDRYFGPSELLPNIPMRDQMYQQLFGFTPGVSMPPNIKGAGNTVMPAMFNFDAYYSSDWTKVTCRTQTAPIFAPTMVDAFVLMDVVP